MNPPILLNFMVQLNRSGLETAENDSSVTGSP